MPRWDNIIKFHLIWSQSTNASCTIMFNQVLNICEFLRFSLSKGNKDRSQESRIKDELS